jgi:hypothetical protein
MLLNGFSMKEEREFPHGIAPPRQQIRQYEGLMPLAEGEVSRQVNVMDREFLLEHQIYAHRKHIAYYMEF